MEQKAGLSRKFGYMAAYFLLSLILGGCAVSEAQSSKEEIPKESTEESIEKSIEEDTEENTEASQDIFAMDTYMTVTAYGEHAMEAVEKAEKEIMHLDALLSTGEETSEVVKLNQTGEGVLSEDAFFLLKRSLEIYEDTEGAFDIAIYPIMQAWGFPTGEHQVPEEKDLKDLLPLADPSQITYDEEDRNVSFTKEGMKIDFGGIAKGYTSERVMEIYQECGITSGIVNLGGNVQVLGRKPDQSLWKVAVQSPEEDGSYLGVLSVENRAVITSGGYERYFEQDGKTYHHIIDPSTGYPAENGLVSVTIVSGDGTLADALSTSLFVMGRDKATDYWQVHSEEFDAILLDEEGKLYVTEGISDSFESDYDVQMVRNAKN